MGRKINPILFRSKFKFKKVNWVDNENIYKNYLKEDRFLHSFIRKFFDNFSIQINSIYIFRKQTAINISKKSLYLIIFLSKQKSQKKFSGTFHLKILLERILKSKYNTINLKILKVKKMQKITEKFNKLIQKITKGISPKLATSNFIEDLKTVEYIIGAKISIVGRINGSEKARKLQTNYGLIPAQTIKSKILFINETIETKDGILNIKFLYNLK